MKWKITLQENREYEAEAKTQPEAVMNCIRGLNGEGKRISSDWRLIRTKEINVSSGRSKYIWINW